MFDLDEAVGNELVKKYKPTFLGKGAEQLVYEITDRPGIVVKVDKAQMRLIQGWNESHNLPLDELDPAMRPDIEKYLMRRRERHARMTSYLGREHVPVQRTAIVKVPVNKEIIKHVHWGTPPQGAEQVTEAWSVVTVQRRVPEVQHDPKLEIGSGHIEHQHPDPDVYGRVTRALVDLDPAAHFTNEEFESLFKESLARIIHFADRDPGLQEAVKDFIARTVRLSNDTGEVFDLVGTYNISFFERDGKWTYRLLDPLLLTSENDPRAAAQAVMEHAARGERRDRGEEAFLLWSAVNFARMVNGLAARYDMTERVDMIPNHLKGKIDFLQLFKKMNT